MNALPDNATDQQITRRPTSYSVPSLPSVAHDVHSDLIFSRRLMQRSLADNDLSAALAFAVATSKLLPVVLKKGLHDHDLLTRPACERLAAEMIDVISDHLRHIDGWESIIDDITK